jgi:RNA-directed DNA polymerase
VDGQTVADAKETFGEWVEPVLRSVHRQGYRAPNIRRVYIPKPGKREKRPLGVPCVNDRALQRSTAQVLSAIYEADLYEGLGVKRDVVLARAAMTTA